MVKPRFRSVPKGNGTLGKEAVALAADAGLELDDWQADVLEASLRRRKDDKWSAPDVGLNVARQNGKGAILVARILAELYLVRSQLIIYSAHNFDTALEHFRRAVRLIEDSPRLRSELIGSKGGRPYGITSGRGSEGIELQGDRRLQIRTRTASGGRGFSCDLLLLDEAMILPEFMLSALEPVISARPNPQIWYIGSAVDQTVHEHGVVWTRVRNRGMGGDDPDLAYFEWSVEGDKPDSVPLETLHDQAAWAQANPALGIRISPEHVAREARGSLGPRGFAVERLGIGDWPRTDHVATNPIDFEAWLELTDTTSVLSDPVCLAFDVSPERNGSISAAGKNEKGEWHVEVAESRPGTAWLPDRIIELRDRYHPLAIACTATGPAASVIPRLEDRDVELVTLTAGEHAQACGQLIDTINERAVRHRGQPELDGAIRAAKTRPLGDAWAWSRKDSTANISPLVSATLALSAAITNGDRGFTFAWV